MSEHQNPGPTDGNRPHDDSSAQTHLPEELFAELFGEQSSQQRAAEGPEDPESVLRQQPQANPSANGSRPGAPRVQGASSGNRSPAKELQKTVGGILKKAKKNLSGKRRTGTTLRSAPAVNTGAYSPADDEDLQILERRIKVSLRETSLPNIARIGVGSPKGGIGKSSTAYGVAGSLAYYTNMRVVLVDCDPNFGAPRLLMPRPIDASVVDLARDADELGGLADVRGYIATNDKMRLDAVLGPVHAYELADIDDLGAAYERVDRVLSRYYDVIVYDLGLGFKESSICRVLSLCHELLLITDSEMISNSMLADSITYIQRLGLDLERTTAVINHRFPPEHESADTAKVREAAEEQLRRVTNIPYDHSMSQLLNRRTFHIESISLSTRMGILGTVMACLEGLENSVQSGATVSANKGR